MSTISEKLTRQELEQMADYWDCQDSETLRHTTIEDAVTAAVDCWLDPKQTAEEVERIIRDKGPSSVQCYVRNEWTKDKRSWYTQTLLERLYEMFDEDEEFGSPEDNLVDRLTHDQNMAIQTKAEELIAEFSSRAVPWCCSVVGEVVLDEDELVKMMREANPHWFEEGSP